MVLDTSAIIAILFSEPGAHRLEEAVLGASRVVVSAGSRVEAGIVALARRGEAAEAELALLLDRLRVDIAPVTASHAEHALDAFRQFGKGRHPASLNFGDCFSYALARTLGKPLLFVGDDFTRRRSDGIAYFDANRL